MGVVGKGFQKGKPEEGEALLTVVPFVKEAAIMQRTIGGAVYCVVSACSRQRDAGPVFA